MHGINFRSAPGVAGLLAGLLASVPVLADEALDAAFPRSTLVISAADACHRFGVHVAIDREQWQRGLMYVREMPADRGMLFVYGDEARRSMWMKNTFIALDMLFIHADGRIENIATDTEPQSLASVSSTAPVQYVLELNAGTSERLGIRPGDVMTWSGELDGAASEN